MSRSTYKLTVLHPGRKKRPDVFEAAHLTASDNRRIFSFAVNEKPMDTLCFASIHWSEDRSRAVIVGENSDGVKKVWVVE